MAATINYNNIIKKIKKLCSPAYFYFIISLISLFILFVENIYNFSTNQYCIGCFKCSVPSTVVVFVVKTIYILFWTFGLNCLCNAGYTNISWLLVLLPFILFFVMIGIMMLRQGVTVIQN